MRIFIISIVLGSIISLCFYGKRFWENRYLVLMIIAGLGLVSTLIFNYVTRNDLNKKIIITKKWDVDKIMLNDTTIDSSFITTNKNLSKWKHISENDSLGVDSAYHFFYYDKNDLVIAYFRNGRIEESKMDNICIMESDSNDIAFSVRIKEKYLSPNFWTFGSSLPRIRTIICLYLPSSDYKTIPDSIMNKTIKLQ